MADVAKNRDGHRSCSLLESLPTEILIHILSSVARCPRDLGSLIRTSSAIYSCFEAFKAGILTASAREDLGPVFPDVVALASTPCLSFNSIMDEAYWENVQHYMHQHRQIIKGPVDISPEIALRIFRLNRAASFFTDLYMGVRRAFLTDQLVYGAIATDGLPPFPLINCPSPWDLALTEEEMQAQRNKLGSVYKAMCQNPLSVTERRRLAQAFFRAELLTNVRCNKTLLHQDMFVGSQMPGETRGQEMSERQERLFDTIFAPFTAWEMELVSQAHYFISSACRALVDVGWTRAGDRNPDRWMNNQARLYRVAQDYQFDLVAFREALVNGGADTCIGTCIPGFDPSAEREVELIPTTSLSGSSREVFLTVPSCHPDATSPLEMECHLVICQLLEEGQGRQNGTDMATGGTNCIWLCASHRHRGGRNGWPPAGGPEAGSECRSQVGEEKRAKSVGTRLPAPYAWTDALDGQEWDRWGLDFVSHPPLTVQQSRLRQEFSRVNHQFSRWRWLGFMFWDEERVQEMKAALDGHATGWLHRTYHDNV